MVNRLTGSVAASRQTCSSSFPLLSEIKPVFSAENPAEFRLEFAAIRLEVFPTRMAHVWSCDDEYDHHHTEPER
jgi:hypothetical protein